MHHDDNVEDIYTMEARVTNSSVLEYGKYEQCRSIRTVSTKSLLKNWQLMSAIILYGVFALYDVAYSEVKHYKVLLNISTRFIKEICVYSPYLSYI
jgi:hypothetical protein